MSLDELLREMEERGLKPLDRGDVISLTLEPSRLRETAKLLVEKGYDHLASVEGIDRPGEDVIEVVYHAESYSEELGGKLVELRVKVPRGEPRVPSLIDVWPNALFLERETWDLMGVEFDGHPELRRLLMPPDWDGPPPLRKDYKVATEGVFVVVE